MASAFHVFQVVQKDRFGEHVLSVVPVHLRSSADEAYREAEELCETVRQRPHKPAVFVRELGSDAVADKLVSGTRTYETTNEALLKVIVQVDTLIVWADSDAQHAAENDAPGVARDDRRRAKTLRKALRLLQECTR